MKIVPEVRCEENFLMNVEIQVGEEKYPEIVKNMIMGYIPRKEVLTDIELKLNLKDEIPVYQRPRRLPMKDKEIVDKQVEEWIQEGIVKPGSSEYGSPVVVKWKKNELPRVCVDYRL